MRHDHLVDEAAFGGDEGIGEALFIFPGARGDLFRVAEFRAVEDFRRTLGAHHRDLGGRPGIVDVGTDMLGSHDVIGAAIGLAGDQRHHRHGGLAIGEEQFCAVLDDAAIFLCGARQEARHVDQREDWDGEGIAEPYEAGGLARAVDVEAAGQHHRLVGDDADRLALDAHEADDDVLGEGLLDFEEITLVGDGRDQFLHVVGLVGTVGDQRVEPFLQPCRIVVEGPERRLLAIVERQEIEQCAHLLQRLDVVLISAIGNRGFLRVRARAAQFFRRNDLVGYGLHHVGTGDEHVG